MYMQIDDSLRGRLMLTQLAESVGFSPSVGCGTPIRVLVANRILGGDAFEAARIRDMDFRKWDWTSGTKIHQRN